MFSECVVYLVGHEPASLEVFRNAGCVSEVRIEQFDDAESFLSRYSSERPACIIVENDLPGMTGLELQQELLGKGCPSPLIFVSRSESIHVVVTAMENGALTYLAKPTHEKVLCPYVIRALGLASERLRRLGYLRELRERFAKLTADERNVLELILEGVPNKTVAIKLDVGLRTVEMRRSNIMRKTGAQSFPELIRLALDVNYPHDQPIRN